MTITAEKVIFVPTGTYNPMYHRHFGATVDENTINQLLARTNNGHNVEAAMLSGCASQILRPIAQPSSTSDIVNGWNERRFRFMAMCSTNVMGRSFRQIITGYTDHMGTTMSGAVDPNMGLYINNTITLRQILSHGQNGPTSSWAVVDNSQIISDPTMSMAPNGGYNNGHFQKSTKATLRPYDIFCRAGTAVLEASDPGNVLDFRTSINNGLVKSHRANTGAPTYLSKIFKAHKNATLESENTNHISMVTDAASATVHDGTLDDDTILSKLAYNTGLLSNGFVSYGDICRWVTHFDDCATFINTNGVKRDGSSQFGTNDVNDGQSEYWHGADNETVTATILQNGVTGIMADTLLTGVWFHAHNSTASGEISVALNPSFPFKSFIEGINMDNFLQIFLQRLVNEILMDISMRNQIQFAVDMYVDILGETKIYISLDGGPSVPYIVPQFADSLFTPVVATHHSALSELSYDIESLASHLSATAFGGVY